MVMNDMLQEETDSIRVDNRCPRCQRYCPLKGVDVVVHWRGEMVQRVVGLSCKRCGPFDAGWEFA